MRKCKQAKGHKDAICIAYSTGWSCSQHCVNASMECVPSVAHVSHNTLLMQVVSQVDILSCLQNLGSPLVGTTGSGTSGKPTSTTSPRRRRIKKSSLMLRLRGFRPVCCSPHSCLYQTGDASSLAIGVMSAKRQGSEWCGPVPPVFVIIDCHVRGTQGCLKQAVGIYDL